MFENLKTAREKAREYLPEEYVKQALQQLTPALGMKPTVTEDSPIGASRVGGSPDLPDHFEWPRATASKNIEDPEFELIVVTDSIKEELAKNTPLVFVCQLNLEELHAASNLANQLPQTGMLYFFYHPILTSVSSDANFCTVIYDDSSASSLKPLELPEELVAEHDRYRGSEKTSPFWTEPQTLSFYEGLTAPQFRMLIPEYADFDQQIENGNHALSDVVDDLLEFFAEAGEFQEPDWAKYQILGTPAPVQSEPRGYLEGENPIDWQLLLQVPLESWQTDGTSEGDIYFLIKKSDLAAGRFDGVRVVFQQS